MNQIITALLSSLGEKGADKKRNASLLVLIFVAYQVVSIEKRVTVIEARLGIAPVAVATNAPSSDLAGSHREKPTL